MLYVRYACYLEKAVTIFSRVCWRLVKDEVWNRKEKMLACLLRLSMSQCKLNAQLSQLTLFLTDMEYVKGYSCRKVHYVSSLRSYL